MFGLGNSYFIDCKCHPGILEHFRYYKRSKFYVKTRVDVIPFHVQVKDYMLYSVRNIRKKRKCLYGYMNIKNMFW